MTIDKNHEIVGKLNSELGDLDIGTLYPVLDADLRVIGVADATQQPEGYYLDGENQAYCKIPAGYWFDRTISELVNLLHVSEPFDIDDPRFSN